MRDVFLAAVFSLGFNIAMFAPAFIYKTDKLTDISYALTFIAVVIFGYTRSDKSMGHVILLVAILAWAIRLGGFLFMRIQRMKRDRRFDDKRDYFFKFLGFWLIQGFTVPVVMLAAILFFSESQTRVGFVSYIGLLMFAVGLLVEAIADHQKFKFSGISTNKDKWIESGLWSVSRHPNYLGEIMVWSGIYIFVFDSLTGLAKLGGLFSPLYIAGLLLFVSGVPLLEKSAEKKWGKDKKYQAYKKRTPVMVPFIGRKY